MNKSRHKLIFICIFLVVPWFCHPPAAGGERPDGDIRPSVFAGSWYPRSRDKLAESIRTFLSEANAVRLGGELKAIIVPHAGYQYSGAVAAHAYKLLKGTHFKRIILIGPSHRVRFRGVSVNLQSGYRTPLGIVPVDRELCANIINSGPDIRYIKNAHALEHSIEIQLPFLQMVLGKFKIVPILIGQCDLNGCRELADALVKVLGDSKDTLLIASSDLSHYYPYNRAKELDHRFIRDVRRLDIQGLYKDLSVKKCEACGGGAVITVLMAAKRFKVNRAVILKYANSGDVTGDLSRVVGYVSIALVRASDTGPHP